MRSGDDSDEIYGRRFPKGIRLLGIALVGISHSIITGAGNGKLHITVSNVLQHSQKSLT